MQVWNERRHADRGNPLNLSSGARSSRSPCFFVRAMVEQLASVCVVCLLVREKRFDPEGALKDGFVV